MKITKIEFKNLAEFINYVINESNKDVVKEEQTTETKVLPINFFIKKISNKRGASYAETEEWLKSIYAYSKPAAFSLLMKEIAIHLDQKYEGPIYKSEEVFTVSTIDGKIYKQNKDSVKNFRNFAAFRTLEDADYACTVLKDMWTEMFSK